MRRLWLVIVFVAVCGEVHAQLSMEAADPAKRNPTFNSDVRTAEQMRSEFYNRVQHRAERAAIRNQRNTVELSASVQGTMTSYNAAWISATGGDNAISAIGNLTFLHSFKFAKFTIDNKVSLKLGGNRTKATVTNADGGTYQKHLWYKNQDEILVSTAPAFKLADSWTYGIIAKFRTQFMPGYTARNTQSRVYMKSTFLAPAYLDISGGFTYTCKNTKFPVKINLSPLSLNATFVSDRIVRDYYARTVLKAQSYAEIPYSDRHAVYCYGLTPLDDTALYEGGSSFQVDFDKYFGKKKIFRYRTTLYGFYGWITECTHASLIRDEKRAYRQWKANPEGDAPYVTPHLAPTFRWENEFDIKASKLFTSSVSLQMYYNKAQTNSIQTQILISIGLKYTYKNK